MLDDHLRLAAEGRVDEDLERNYAPDVVVLIRDGVHHGHDGVRRLADRLEDELPDAAFTYTHVLAERRFGLLEWTAEADGARVRDGVDAFVIEDGRVVAQTISYSVEPASDASPWVQRFADLVPPGGTVLDLAAGRGRHTRLFHERGHPVVAVDRDVSGFADLGVEVVRADLERAAWPLAERRFDGVVVTNYLHRPLLPMVVQAVAPGGALIYETFADGQQRHGRPSNPDHLLRPGELLDAVVGSLRVVAYEDVELPRPARVQRIAAVRD